MLSQTAQTESTRRCGSNLARLRILPFNLEWFLKSAWLQISAYLMLISCGIVNTDHDAGIIAVTLPIAPISVDTSFQIRGMRAWYIVPNAQDSSYDQINIKIGTPDSTKCIYVFIDSEFIESFPVSDSFCSLAVNIANLSAGSHSLLLSADNNDSGFAAIPFKVSHPLYAVVSCDWDHVSINADNILRQDTLHINHSELLITHFAGPYLLTDTTVAESIVTRQVEWLKNAASVWHDEIGLHIHPYCHFVQAAGLSCVVDFPFDGSSYDSSGYLIGCNRYTESEFIRLLAVSDSLFRVAGLGKPTSFRAGGWSADINTIRALSFCNYTVDASGLNVAHATELADGFPLLYNWAAANWAHINDTSQPYYPNQQDIASIQKPQLPCLEVPNNGVLADFITAKEMKNVFKAIWPGGALSQPKQLSIGYHPDTFFKANFDKMDTVLNTLDEYLAKNDGGPVIYAKMSDLQKVWPY